MPSSASHTIAIIPARYASKRLPGKPLSKVAGRSLIEHVWRITCAAKNLDAVYVATDDERIQEHVESFGGQAIMTPVDCANGTERAAAAITKLPQQPDYIINMQGDAILTPPWVISEMVKALQTSNAPMVTPAVALDWTAAEQLASEKETTPASGTLVVTDKENNALYFSKNMIPYIREKLPECPYQRHIGLYGFTTSALKKFVELPESLLEKTEGLEQLRALENSINIKVVPVNYNGRSHGSIDSPEDIPRIEAIIAKEGLMYDV